MIFANEWRGARGRYLDYFLHFRGLESKRGNVKPSYLIEIHSEIGILFHILVHHGPNTGEIVMKFAVYIVDNICKRMEGGGQRPLCQTIVFDRNTQRNRYIVSHSGPSRPEYRRDRLKFAVYMVDNICKRMEGGQRPLSRLLLAL